MQTPSINATAVYFCVLGAIAHLGAALIANAQEAKPAAVETKQSQLKEQTTKTTQDDKTRPQAGEKGKWLVALSHWSLRGSILRETGEKGTLGILSLAKAAEETRVNSFELSSQLLEVDVRRLLATSLPSELKDDKAALAKARIVALQRIHEIVAKPDHIQVSLDHLEPLTLPYVQRDGNRALESPSNVPQYARWMVEVGSKLQVRCFSLTVAERGLTREEAATTAAETLVALVDEIRNIEVSADKSLPVQSPPRPAEERKPNQSERDGSRQESNKDQEVHAEPKDQEPEDGPAKTPRSALPLHILLETGEGFRSDPKWLAGVLQIVRTQLSDRRFADVTCSILLNLERQRVDEANAMTWKDLAVREGVSPFIGGVVVGTQSFVVAPSIDDATKVVVMAERRVDYAAALQVIAKYVGPNTPVVVRYLGPALYETNGIEASMALAKRLVTPAMERQRKDENEQPK